MQVCCHSYANMQWTQFEVDACEEFVTCWNTVVRVFHESWRTQKERSSRTRNSVFVRFCCNLDGNCYWTGLFVPADNQSSSVVSLDVLQDSVGVLYRRFVQHFWGRKEIIQPGHAMCRGSRQCAGLQAPGTVGCSDLLQGICMMSGKEVLDISLRPAWPHIFLSIP